MNVQIEASWKQALAKEFIQPYFQSIIDRLKIEKQQQTPIYPPGSQIFNAFNLTPLDKVKVVIIGQDPYHGPKQAHGLSFSVQKGVAIPPSLMNIYKELADDIGMRTPTHGDLTTWAEQGVFLLNASLTVKAGEPMSHAKIGWADFTNAVIKTISEQKQHVVFLLWGKFAQEKRTLIDESKHLILRSVHPSPLSAYGGFFGCKHFSKTNEYLVSKGLDPINWIVS